MSFPPRQPGLIHCLGRPWPAMACPWPAMAGHGGQGRPMAGHGRPWPTKAGQGRPNVCDLGALVGCRNTLWRGNKIAAAVWQWLSILVSIVVNYRGGGYPKATLVRISLISGALSGALSGLHGPDVQRTKKPGTVGEFLRGA